jgi:hypothetical protein
VGLPQRRHPVVAQRDAGFCGIRVRGVTRLAEVRHRSDADRERWIGGMASLGEPDAESVAPRESEELVPA